MNLMQRILYKPFFIRLFHWEYWPFNAVYAPIIPIWLWLCFKERSFFFFSASNPSIEYGGFLMESKKRIYDLMPEAFYPRTLLVKRDTIPDGLLDLLKDERYRFPLIAKPDIGGRGRGVKKLNNEGEVLEYAYNSKLDFLIQEFVSLPREAGIFFYRYPGIQEGQVSGIVSKEFLTVIGDGLSTIRELCMKEKRFVLQIADLEKMYGEKMGIILEAGYAKELVPYGNHSRGAKFIDDSHLADERLVKSINNICGKIKGFHYGRLDIRFNTWEELKEGKNFSVIEVNGAGSEPTHMYDPRHSVVFAWKEIIRHWIILWRISRLQHSAGIAYMGFKEGKKM
ncbi:MAG: D-alanine--D-alanine ligase, partial [Chitinophagaceae bacterium]|nr:D-alanine--D-alanine ligase [Chitinophagaceae bacterium]